MENERLDRMDVSGERVYKVARPTILDEVPTEKVDDVIEGKLVEDSLYDNIYSRYTSNQ